MSLAIGSIWKCNVCSNKEHHLKITNVVGREVHTLSLELNDVNVFDISALIRDFDPVHPTKSIELNSYWYLNDEPGLIAKVMNFEENDVIRISHNNYVHYGVMWFLRHYRPFNRDCIKCNSAKVRHLTFDEVAKDRLCWSCKNV